MDDRRPGRRIAEPAHPLELGRLAAEVEERDRRREELEAERDGERAAEERAAGAVRGPAGRGAAGEAGRWRASGGPPRGVRPRRPPAPGEGGAPPPRARAPGRPPWARRAALPRGRRQRGRERSARRAAGARRTR